MGGVDLVDMMIALCRIPARTKRWYIKVFWHLIDIRKVNGWVFYRRHCKQLGIQKRFVLQLREFSAQLAKSLMFANKSTPRGRLSKRTSIEEAPNRR